MKHISKQRRRGYSLVETLVALAIVGLLVSVAAPRLLNQLSNAKIKTASIQIASLSAALDIFFLDTGRYPTTQEGLAALVAKPNNIQNWSGPYIKGDGKLLDPWGNKYVYQQETAGSYKIISFGSDGVEGGTGSAADVISSSGQ